MVREAVGFDDHSPLRPDEVDFELEDALVDERPGQGVPCAELEKRILESASGGRAGGRQLGERLSETGGALAARVVLQSLVEGAFVKQP